MTYFPFYTISIQSNLTLEEPETLEEVMGIDPSTPLTILRDNEWPPGGGKGSEIRTERKVPKRKSPCKQNVQVFHDCTD